MAQCRSAEEIWKQTGYYPSDKDTIYPVAFGVLTAKVEFVAREIERCRETAKKDPKRACNNIFSVWDSCMEDILK